MTTRKITAKIGTKVEYKIIKDGFDTVSNNIVLNENTPKQIHLAPSQEVYNSDIQYELDQTKPCSPIIDIVEDFHLPDDTIFPAKKYILAPLNQTYRIPGETEAPSTYNNNFSLIGNVRQFYNILENFSTSNYVVLQNVFDSSLPWTVVFKFNFYTIDDTAKVLLGYNSSGLFKLAIYNKKLEFSVSTSTSDWNIGQIVGTQVFQTYKDYWIKVEFTGSAYNAYVSEDGLTYDLEGTIESSEAFVVPNQFVIGNGGWQFNEVFTGSIDLNETYIQVNRKMWWKPEYKNIIGWYSTVGSRGVISGGLAKYFSSNDYLRLNTMPNDISSADLIFKGTTSDLNTHNAIIANISSEQYYGIRYNHNKSFSIYNNGWVDGINTLYTNIWYWFRVTFDGTTWTGYTLEDKNYTKETLPDISMWRQEWTTTNGFLSGNTFNLGFNPITIGEEWKGSLDLSQSSIILNDELWWDGTNYQQIGYWDANGVTKGFNSSNYLSIPYAFKPGSKTWEVSLKIISPSTFSLQRMIGSVGDYYKTIGGEVASNGTLGFGITSNGSSWDIGWMGGSTILEPNTPYWIRLSYDGTQYKFELSSNGIDYNLENSIASSTSIYQGDDSIINLGYHGTNSSTYFQGSIYLNESYIKIDNKLWWKGVAKDNFTNANFQMVGTPSIDMNGVVSNFSDYNYIVFPYAGNNETEIFTTFITGTDISNMANIITFLGAGEIYIRDSVIQTWNIETATDITLTSILPNTMYSLRMKMIPGGRIITIYDADNTIIVEQTINDSGATFNNNSIVNFGFYNANSTFRYWKGSINLANTYVIVDGVKYNLLEKDGEYLRGILDPSFVDEYTQEQLAKLYCVTLPNSQHLCLTKENVNDEKAIYKQYITDITIPVRDVIYSYDENTETWTSNTQDESDREPNSGEEEIEPANNIKYYAFDPDDNSFLTTANTNGGFNCNTDIFFSTSTDIGTHQVLYMLNPETDNMVAITNVEVNISADSIKVYPKGPHFFSAPVQANAIRYEAGDILANETPEASTTATLSNSNVSIT